MRYLIALCATACVTLGVGASALAASQQKDGYMLRDTSSLSPPAAGQAQVVVARDMRILEVGDEEYVFVDRIPVGKLAQRTAVVAEVPPGWHRVWLGRGRPTEVWMQFEPNGRYLLRLRERTQAGAWRGDLVRETAAGYAEFALGKGMKLAVMDARGQSTLMRDLERSSKTTPQQDSLARERAIANAALPIVIPEAWYVTLPSEVSPGVWQNRPGKLTVDQTSLRFVSADTFVVEIPRQSITDVYFGAQKGNLENPWIKVSFKENQTDKEAAFADAKLPTATENYNRLFAELAKGIAPR